MATSNANQGIGIINANVGTKENKPEWLLYSQDSYEFNIDEKLKKKFIIDTEKYKKRISSYNKSGIRNTVIAILLCHRHEYPHLLLLQNLLTQEYYFLGGKYNSWEKPRDVLKKKLQKYINKIQDIHFSVNKLNINDHTGNIKNKDEMFDIGEFLGEWWRTQYDSIYLSYLPAHITRPKECARLYQVTISDKCIFHLPPGFTLKAIPLFDLNNCGIAISGLSSILSRFKLSFMVQDQNDNLS
ncbi:hypothetical protein YYC_02310 [Plasmodium yoelii 17X]|uniref:Cleavage and polyadenylation specificity factor subunit 5 n=3 Tax=Plasmodium yoelii TaxID=5861 RepID=A0AAF0B2H4_PLAYO|nr:cleavage and polyadenylation specificity factor subunit 5, putative [Plasmodium yoelii]ETB60690.1 hypothetical protein YYC_02310 [Plasmodium yoelii 17X]WBY54705.1 cleavage and polyadenylation specificity factor subunit 5 [Plasmodium yoelii yoelii]CDU16072.1 mRNA cleavage factor-like protein, putative [Plasmodium yoelii]VTZ71697.1 cleavage and polyadenylation specificity factor subunit 5, putative [Plasmodium yoelii]|eukprot:XP_022811344.1 cleavage and polyadenylation specificity factor subunit 5, putative [Plasmodium yoelii]